MKINFGPAATGNTSLCTTCKNAAKRTITKGGSIVNQQQEVWCMYFAPSEGYARVIGTVTQCNKYDGKTFSEHDAWDIGVNPVTKEIEITPSYNARQRIIAAEQLRKALEKQSSSSQGSGS